MNSKPLNTSNISFIPTPRIFKITQFIETTEKEKAKEGRDIFKSHVEDLSLPFKWADFLVPCFFLLDDKTFLSLKEGKDWVAVDPCVKNLALMLAKKNLEL